MKTILKITLGCMVCLEILSPLMIGLLNSNSANAQNNAGTQLRIVEHIGIASNSGSILSDTEEINYSDSKSLMIKE